MDRLDEAQAPPTRETTRRIADEQRGLVPQADTIRITDASGVVLNADGHPTTSVADRDYFAAARERPLELVISEPLLGRIISKWGVILARARAPHGQFRGIVYSNISSDHFLEEFARVQLGVQGAITLRSASLRLIARYTPESPASNIGVGTTQVSPRLHEALAADPRRGFFITKTAIDGIERTTAYQRVGDYPLYLFVGLATEEYYLPWRRETTAIIAFATLLEAVILALSWVAYSSHIRQALDKADLGRLNAQQQALLDNDLVGTVKLKGRVAVWHNKAMAALFGYEPDELNGKPSRILYGDEATYEDVGRAYREMARGQSYRGQVKMVRKDGRVLWIDLSGMQLPDGESLWMMVDITAVKDSEAHAQRLALQDPLTGLGNRLHLTASLPQLLRDAERAGRKAAVCYLDLDGFKAVNDRLGHDAGDALLRETARRITECLRANDIVARLGGDEFVIVLGGLHGGSEVDLVCGRILASVSAPIDLGGGEIVSVQASIGVALHPEHAEDAGKLLELADQAMYAAKRRGRNCFVVHSDSSMSAGQALPPESGVSNSQERLS